jgi:hypothetical protein
VAVADSGEEGDEHVVGHVLLSASRLDTPTRLVDVLVLSDTFWALDRVELCEREVAPEPD